MWGSREHPILVLHLESPSRGGQGDSVYRTEQPCRALRELPGVNVVTGSFLSPKVHSLLRTADVLVLCDVVESDLFPILRERRAKGLVTIYEINDDFQAPQPWNQTAYLAQNSITRSLTSQVAASCDGIQYSTPYLEERFRALSPCRAVFVNHVWQLPTWEARVPSANLRIGWGGSLGHKEDLRAIVDVMGPILSRYPHVTFHVMGPSAFLELVRQLPAGRFTHQSGGPIESYLDFVAELNIGVCHLEATDFNLGRSDVKFLEYASYGVATVASKLPPYQESVRDGETGILYEGPNGLERALTDLIENTAVRLRIGAAARTYVQANRLEQGHAVQRLSFMRQCRERLMSAGSPAIYSQVEVYPDSQVEVSPDVGAACPDVRSVDDLTSALLEGLAASRDSELPSARASFKLACELGAGFYLPLLYLGSVEEDHGRAIESLEAGLLLNPSSVASLVLIADRFEALGNLGAARAALEQADKLAPEFGVPLARLAELAANTGDLDLAASLLEAAVGRNPYYALPHVRSVLAQIDRGQALKTDVLERCLKVDERFWATRFALGLAALNRGTSHLARKHLLVALKYAPDPAPVLAQLARAEVALGDLDAARKWLAAAKVTKEQSS